uniref:Uncharacterized protein n=1 Tax=Anopheles merus TaxID=30066 RepID=A0A182VBA1_ANOME
MVDLGLDVPSGATPSSGGMQASCVPADGFMPPGPPPPPPPPPPPLFTLAAFEILELVLMIVFGPFVMAAVADDVGNRLLPALAPAGTPLASTINDWPAPPPPPPPDSKAGPMIGILLGGCGSTSMYSTSSLIFLICSTSTPSLSSIRSSVSSFVTWNLCRSSLPFSSSILSCLSLSSFFFFPASSDSTSHSN